MRIDSVSRGFLAGSYPIFQGDIKSQNAISPIDSNAKDTFVKKRAEKPSAHDLKTLNAMKREMTPEAQTIWENGKIIARKMGSKTLETEHLFLASLLSVRKNMKELDNGVIKYGDDARFKSVYSLEQMITTNFYPIGNEETRKEIEKVVNKHIKKVSKEFRQGPSEKAFPFMSTPPSKACVDDLIEGYSIGASAAQSDIFYDNYFIVAANSTGNRKLLKECLEFTHDLQKVVMTEEENEDKKYGIDFYSKNAKGIWKNLDLGNNVIFLHDTDNKESAKHLVSSFKNYLKSSENKEFKHIDPEKTDIITLNENATFDFLSNLARNVKTDPSKKGRTTVIVADLWSLIKNVNGQLDLRDAEVLTKYNKKEKGGSNISLVFALNPLTYYTNTEDSAPLAKDLKQYAVQRIPAMTASDTIKCLTDENGIKFVKQETKRDFTPEAIQKAIEITNKESGNFPDKAIYFLDAASKYYIDKETITPEDIEAYSNEIKNLSEASSKNGTGDIVFDTGKKLSDIVGSPMTKKDAESIVKQIKDGTIGTRGFIAQLDNGSAYGGGRKHTAEAIAGEAGIPMITIDAKGFAMKDIDALNQNANYSELQIRKIVSNAKAQAQANENKTAMIFIENFDNFGADPLYGISSVYEQKAFSQLLSEMESVRKENKVNLIIVGSVNRAGLIDENILKPYKFLNAIIVYPPQDSKQRQEVLNYYIEKNKLNIKGNSEEQKQILKDISETTEGFTVSDLIYLLDEADKVSRERGENKISSSHFTEAFLRATTGRTNEAEMSDSWKKIVTSHEAGHALTLQIMYDLAEKQAIPWHLPDKVNFITLDPRGDYGGAMYHKSSSNRTMSFEKIMSNIVCSYGGHSAESKIYNMTNGSWGISADLEGITAFARAAVMDMGMGPKTGVAHIQRNAYGEPNVSDAKKQAIEDDVDLFLNTGKQISDMIVENYKDFILEFTKKYSGKVGTGECIVPSKQFEKELSEWKNNLPEEKQQELQNMEDKILDLIQKAKTGKK